nr:hypothetical protein [Candidatus Microthrix sp.]
MPHTDTSVVGDFAGHGHVGWIGDQTKELFGGGEFGDGAGGAMPAAKVTNVDREVVEGHLCGLEAVDAAVRHQRWVMNLIVASTTPLRFPCLGGHGSTPAP